MSMHTSTGRIKHVQHSFAFLTGDEDGVDRFFHRSELRLESDPSVDLSEVDLTTVLVEHLAVSFLPVLHRLKGPRAIQVTLLSNTPTTTTPTTITPVTQTPSQDC